MAKLTLSDLTNLQNEASAIATLAANNALIETAIENTLSRDGTSPNTMNADLDMNSNNILNLPYPASDTEPVRLGDMSDLIPQIFFQASSPVTTGPEGSIWIDSDSTDLDVYRLTSAVWVDTTANLKGSSGATGATGSSGANGLDGTSVGVEFQYSTTTTASDPGAGYFRFNNATIASATAMYIDNVDYGGSSTTTWLDSFDDSTNTTHYGYIFLRGKTTPSAWAVASLTSTVTDSTGYRTLGSISVVASGGTWTNNDRFIMLFMRTGNKGADGAGSGDVVGPASSVDSEIALFSSTTGKLIKRASTTGILKGTSGVISAAVSGTDYAPATSGSAILKGSGAGGFSDAAAGTDYVAPGGALGTPSSGTLTNCTGLPVAGITASTSTALGVGSIELGHATDTTISRSSAGIIAVEGITIPRNTTSDTLTIGSIELGAATDTTLSRSAAGELAVEGTLVKKVGKETIWIPAVAMYANTTNGAASGSAEMTTNKNMFKTLDFDPTTQEFASFEVHFPKSWNLGTVTFQPVWSHASTTTNFGVVWGLCAVARSDDDAGDVAFGTAQTSTDTGGTTNDIYIGPESSAITIAGTPAAGDTVQFRVQRTPADGSDTMAIDARLHGIRLFYTSSASTDV